MKRQGRGRIINLSSLGGLLACDFRIRRAGVCVYEMGDVLPAHPPEPVWEGKIEWKDSEAQIRLRNSQGATLKESLKIASHAAATERLLDLLSSGGVPAVAATSEID